MRIDDLEFYLCYGCAKNNGRGDGHSMDGCPSGVPTFSNTGSGCMMGLLLLPFFFVKATFMHIFN